MVFKNLQPLTKRYLIISLGSLIIILISLLVLRSKSAKPLPVINKESLATIGNLPIETIKGIDFNVFPKKLPLFEITYAIISDEEAKNLAANLGFANEPQVIDDIQRGQIYLFHNDTNYLSITLSLGKIEFGSLKIQENFQTSPLNDNQLVAAASDFLKNSFNLSLDNFDPAVLEYLSADPYGEEVNITSRDRANIIQANFVYKLKGMKLVTFDTSQPLFFVRLLPNGNIFSASLVKFSSINEIKQLYNLKSLEDINASLREVELFSLADNSLNIADIDRNSIKNIKVNHIELVYLQSTPESKIIYPSFIFDGEAQMQDASQLKVKLYLSAVKNR